MIRKCRIRIVFSGYRSSIAVRNDTIIPRILFKPIGRGWNRPFNYVVKVVVNFNSGTTLAGQPALCVQPPSGNNEREVGCSLCGLEPICRVLEYGVGEIELPEGILLRRQQVAKGETVFRTGDPFRSIFAVKSGSFMNLIKTPDGEEQVTGFSLVGELIGAEGLAGGYYNCTARAVEPSSICELRMEQLQQAGQPAESLQQGIIMLLAQEVAFCRSVSSSLIRQKGEKRLAAFVLSVSNRLAARGMSGTEFKLNMSQTDIASYLGLSRETVSRGLAKMRKDGISKVRGKHFELQDMDQLRRLAGSI